MHKKRGVMDSDKAVLAKALSELSKEIGLLSRQKKKLETEVETVREEVESARETETKLRQRLNKVTAFEVKLATEMGEKENNLATIRNKIIQVRRAREELTNTKI